VACRGRRVRGVSSFRGAAVIHLRWGQACAAWSFRGGGPALPGSRLPPARCTALGRCWQAEVGAFVAAAGNPPGGHFSVPAQIVAYTGTVTTCFPLPLPRRTTFPETFRRRPTPSRSAAEASKEGQGRKRAPRRGDLSILGVSTRAVFRLCFCASVWAGAAGVVCAHVLCQENTCFYPCSGSSGPAGRPRTRRT